MALVFRDAIADDLPAIVALLADDMLGRDREEPGPPIADGYRSALAAIEEQPGNRFIVADMEGRVVGCLQLVLMPAMSRVGAMRGLLEDVRVASDRRAGGIGRQLVEYAVEEARAAGCGVIELTAHESREGAHRFYETLGFKAVHRGFKLYL